MSVPYQYKNSRYLQAGAGDISTAGGLTGQAGAQRWRDFPSSPASHAVLVYSCIHKRRVFNICTFKKDVLFWNKGLGTNLKISLNVVRFSFCFSFFYQFSSLGNMWLTWTLLTLGMLTHKMSGVGEPFHFLLDSSQEQITEKISIERASLI